MSEANCGLHLWDLFQAHPDHEAASRAQAVLARYCAQGAALKRESAIQAAESRVRHDNLRLDAARRKLFGLIAARGGLRWSKEKRRLVAE